MARALQSDGGVIDGTVNGGARFADFDAHGFDTGKFSKDGADDRIRQRLDQIIALMTNDPLHRLVQQIIADGKRDIITLGVGLDLSIDFKIDGEALAESGFLSMDAVAGEENGIMDDDRRLHQDLMAPMAVSTASPSRVSATS